MTNREWLRSLSNKELEEWLCDEMYDDEYEHDCMFDEPRSEKQDIIYLYDFPSADFVKVKYGEWIENDNGTYSCSLCQSWIPKEQYYYARYCLHCGANMR